MRVYERFARPILFSMPHERVHDLAKTAMRVSAPIARMGFRVAADSERPDLECSVGGLTISGIRSEFGSLLADRALTLSTLRGHQTGRRRSPAAS